MVKREEADKLRTHEEPKKLLDMAKQLDSTTEESVNASLKRNEEARRQLRNEEHARILEKCKEDRSNEDNPATEGSVIQEKEGATDETRVKEETSCEVVVEEKEPAAEDAEFGDALENDSSTEDGNILKMSET